MNVCYCCRVAGRVQGVFFRVSTREQAEALGLQGYVRNLPDGCVEVLACGDSRSVEQLREWLWIGPSAAVVRHVACEQRPFVQQQDFQVA